VSIAAWWIEEYQRECTISHQVVYHTWCRVLGSTPPTHKSNPCQPVRGLVCGPYGVEILCIHNKLTIAEYWFLEVGNPWFFNASNVALGYWSQCHVSVYNMFMLFEELANSIEMIQKRNVIYQKRESLGVKNTCFARIVLWL
jgi:hypothetical protein